MNYESRFFLVVLVMLLFSSCGPRTIPRDELKSIFKEAYLVNAYYEIGGRRGSLDSVDMYGPILKKHGYRVRDLEHTVNNFSRKKSARLSDVVEQAIEELSEESAFYDYRLSLVDTLDNIVARTYKKQVLWRDSLMDSLFMPAPEGGYEIDFSYFIDSLNKGRNLRLTVTILDSVKKRRTSESSYLSARDVRRRPKTMKIMADSLATEIKIDTGAKIDSLRIVYYLPREKGLDSFSARWNNLGRHEKTLHSRPYGTHAPWADSLAAPNSGQ